MTLHERPELAVQTATVHIFPECKPKDYANDTLRFEAITRELYLQIQGFCNPNKTVVVMYVHCSFLIHIAIYTFRARFVHKC